VCGGGGGEQKILRGRSMKRRTKDIPALLSLFNTIVDIFHQQNTYDLCNMNATETFTFLDIKRLKIA